MKAPAGLDTFVTRNAMIAVLPHGRSTATFGLGGTGVVQADGSVEVTQSDHGLRLRTVLSAPWAKDASGTPLPTWYTIAGGHSLVQHVETRGAVFPIAADPRLTFGRGVYLNVTGAEAKALASAIMAAGGVTGLAVCRGLVRLPVVVGRLASMLCPLIGASRIMGIFTAIVGLWRGAATRSTYTCYQKRIVGSSTNWHAVAMKNCTG